MAERGLAFLLDANLPRRLSAAMRELGEQVYHVDDMFGRGTPDEIWIKGAATKGWHIISWPDVKAYAKKHPAQFTAGIRARGRIAPL